MSVGVCYNSRMKALTITGTLTAVALVCATTVAITPTPSQARVISNSGISQTGAGWGLASALGADNIKKLNYWYPKTAGSGATIYVVDSGVSNSETIFNGNVTKGFNALNGDVNGSANNDCIKHGTKVAAVAAGTDTGVAKKSTIVPVKVGECNTEGYDSAAIVAGLEWVKANPPANGSTGIVNLSFGYLRDQQYDDGGIEAAVEALADAGFVVTVAAGNDSGEAIYDACDNTPARVAKAITVGAYSYSEDGQIHRADFSESGACIDIWAPGDSVDTKSSDGFSLESGTSIAAPYVAGLAALLIGENIKYSASQIESMIKEYGSKEMLVDTAEYPLNANTVFKTTGNFTVKPESINIPTVNLIAQMPFNVPATPEQVKNFNINRFWGDAYISWDADNVLKDSSKISYIVSYAKIEDGYVKSEGQQIVTSGTSIVLHDLGDEEYAYKIYAVNDGVAGESTGWVHTPVFFFCVLDVCFS